MSFHSHFKIIEERNCPYYSQHDGFTLSVQSVELPNGRPACIILIRELTGLLVTLLPHAATEFADYQSSVFTCGGCTGLIKFQLTDQPLLPNTQKQKDGVVDPEAVMSGKIEAILPAELLQVFHMHQKTGRLVMDLEGGSARVTFREGGLLAARFEELDNQEAIYEIISKKSGSFKFIPGLPDSLMKAREIGDFMMILMEGLKRLDEDD
jgi:hypothetical protein